MRRLKKGWGSKQTQLPTAGGTENPHVLFEKPRVSAKLHVWCFVHVSVVVGPFFHRSNCEWGQLPGHDANVRHPCNF